LVYNVLRVERGERPPLILVAELPVKSIMTIANWGAASAAQHRLAAIAE
jgi:hypothetical protein